MPGIAPIPTKIVLRNTRFMKMEMNSKRLAVYIRKGLIFRIPLRNHHLRSRELTLLKEFAEQWSMSSISTTRLWFLVKMLEPKVECMPQLWVYRPSSVEIAYSTQVCLKKELSGVQ